MKYFKQNTVSSYEKIVIEILNKNNVSFEKEKTFNDLYHGRLRFDFYLPKYNCCIECDGEQHFRQIRKFQKTRQDFLKQQEHDRIKNSYCLAKRIKLYRIPYWDFINIKNLEDLFNCRRLVRSKWHNDYLTYPKK